MSRSRTLVAASLVVAVAAPLAVMVARDGAQTPAPTGFRPPDATQAAAPDAPPRADAEPQIAEPPAPPAPAEVAVAGPSRDQVAQATQPAPATTGGSVSPSTAARSPGSDAERMAASRERAASPGLSRPLVALSAPRLAESGVRSPPPPPAGFEARTPEPSRPGEPVGRDQFAGATVQGFKAVREAPVSTFSLDVDTASYSFTRAALNRNVLPPAAAVRTEEFVNYFPYSYEGPASAAEPFRAHLAVFPSPWAEGRKIVRIGLKGYGLRPDARPRANLVFLIDASGSMDAPNRLPLVKQSLSLLVGQLAADDRVAIVTYAGGAGTVLEPTSAADKTRILQAIETIQAGGSTAGAEGIRQAYALAARNLDPTGVNRVVLATDGDFNVGITNRDELKGFVERERGKGVFLSVLGFGMGNHNDALMQALAQNGNGTAAYIDTLAEARKVLVEEATSTLIPIAKDVKIQVEFNPAAVAEYRLIGYETRLLAREDFSNDKVDAGEVGSGASVTALYEIVPAGGPRTLGDLRYGERAPGTASGAAEYGFLQLRYKRPREENSQLMTWPIGRDTEAERFEDAPGEARFATAVAGFAEILRGGKHTGGFGFDDAVRIASGARGDDPFGYRSEFVQLVRAAKSATALPPLRR